jgi:hypothetical protein
MSLRALKEVLLEEGTKQSTMDCFAPLHFARNDDSFIILYILCRIQ